MIRRRDLLLTAAAASVAPMGARSQEVWPRKPLTVVVPFGAGGSADLVARIFGQKFQDKYGVPVVIENRGGAGGSIAAGLVARASNDGHTLLIGSVSTHAIQPSLLSKLPYDTEKDFAPISPVVEFPNLLIVGNELPVHNIPELISYLKREDGKVNYGSGGNGTSSHLCMVLFMRATRTSMTHVPFRATPDEMNALIGGHIGLAFDGMTTAWALAKGGSVRALGVTTAKRAANAPEIPAIGETVSGFEAVGWQGFFAPAGTPQSVLDMLADEVRRIFSSPDVAATLLSIGGSARPMRPEEFAQFVRNERGKWAEVIKGAGLQSQ
jgi:tripartite-type tricarboxylate transporter receptor subunit TctC